MLTKALNAGMIPRHYNSSQPNRLIQSYVGDYLKEEIVAEALTRNIKESQQVTDKQDRL